MNVVKNARCEHGGDDTIGNQLCNKYEIERCADWISYNGYRKVCLQFPDELLCDAVNVKIQLEVRTNVELYVSADATFRSCCLDLKTAKHVNADAVIHFGRICSSRFQCDSIASLFVLPAEFLNLDALIGCVTSLVEQKRCNVVLLYDVAFSHYARELDSRLDAFRSSIVLSGLLVDAVSHSCGTASVAEKNAIEKLGRRYSVNFDDGDRSLVYVYVVSSSNRKNFENFVMSSPDSIFYSYDSRADILTEQRVPTSIKKALFHVEKVKQARRIGILVATLEAHSFLDSVRRIRKLCRLKKKKTYVISVGKLNVAKLANFPEIDLFVMISCPEVEILDRKDYFQTIVTAMELELALNDNYRWMGKVVADFSEFLPPRGSEYEPINEDASNLEDAYADVSLLNNNRLVVGEATGTALAHCGNVVSTVGDSRLGLSNRSWTGLQTQIADNIAVSIVTVGRTGTPAAGYETPFSDRVT